MDPCGYRLSEPVMRKLYELVTTGQIRQVGTAKRPEMAERNRFIYDLICMLNGRPNYQ